jgi:hypothetical protein
MKLEHLEHLSDDALVDELTACCVTSRKVDARILVFLGMVEERSIFLLRACSSMWDFCRRKLGLSGGQAHRRIASARLAMRYPFILPLVEQGIVHLSTLAQIQVFVSDDNAHALIADTAGKSRDEVDRVLEQRFGFQKKRKQRRGMLETDDELEGLIERARELTSHVYPDGDRLKIAKRAFRVFIAEAEKKVRAKADRPRATQTPASASVSAATAATATKSIPRASTRAMFERHGEQCCYVDEKTGERCPSRMFIQRDHRLMRSRGGTHDPKNLRPMCGPHNRLLARLALGRAYVERRIDEHRIDFRPQKHAKPEGSTDD